MAATTSGAQAVLGTGRRSQGRIVEPEGLTRRSPPPGDRTGGEAVSRRLVQWVALLTVCRLPQRENGPASTPEWSATDQRTSRLVRTQGKRLPRMIRHTQAIGQVARRQTAARWVQID